MTKRFDTTVLLSLFFLSGLSGLIYESVWLQQLSLIFGSTELALAAVLASYMAGLAIGASIISLFISTIKKPLKFYVIIEIIIAIAALSVPYLLDFVANLYSLLFMAPSIESSSSSSALFTIFGAFMVLLIPTSLMGATLPLLSKYSVKGDDNLGNKIGILYSVNTLGACSGALISAFLLLPFFGLGMTTYVAVLINIIIFIIGFYYFNNKSIVLQTTDTLDKNTELFKNKWIFPVIFTSGAVSFAYEILWTRLLSHILGGSVYSFGVMLFVFLLAIAIGAYFGSIMCKRYNPIKSFSWIQLGIALSFYLSFYYSDLLPNIDLSREYGSFSFVSESLFIGLLTLFPGALFIGATFPLAIDISAKNNLFSGIVSARVYTWNTLGAIFGSVLMGFYLMSEFGFAISTKILTSISLIIAITTALYTVKSIKSTLVMTVCLLLVWIVPLQNPYNLLKFSVLGHKTQIGAVRYLGIGESATVMLIDQNDEMRLLTNGLPESAIQIAGAREGKYYLAHWLSMLPVLVNPNAKEMLIVGLGAGITLKATPASIKHIDVVELEQEVINANKMLSKWRGIDPLLDPRLNLHINDARNALRNSTQTFDIIVSQPSHPWTAGAASLYTKEFFALVNKRLRKQGVFIQWIGMRFVNQDLLKSLLATLNSEFNYVELYQPLSKGGLMFVSSNQTIQMSEQQFEKAENKRKWQALGINSIDQIKISKRLNAKSSKQLSLKSNISTDYFNLLKINSPKIIKSSLTKLQLNNMLAAFDPLINTINQQPYNIIRRLIKERDLYRAQLLASYIKNKRTHRIVLAIIIDAQSKTLIEKTTTSKVLMELLVQLDKDNKETQLKDIDELLFHLIRNNTKALLNRNMPQLQKIIDSKPQAKIIFNGLRFNQLRKWPKLEQLDIMLSTFDDSHPAYELANNLRIQWRAHSSRDEEQLRFALNLVDNKLATTKYVKFLFLRTEIGIKLNHFDVAIASMYELLSSALNTKPQQLKLYISKLIKKTIIQAKKSNYYSKALEQEIKKLQVLLTRMSISLDLQQMN